MKKNTTKINSKSVYQGIRDDEPKIGRSKSHQILVDDGKGGSLFHGMAPSPNQAFIFSL